MARDYPGRAEWEDEMKAALRIPTWEIFDKSDGVVCPAGLLLSLGDGSAVEVTAEMLAGAWSSLGYPGDGTPLSDIDIRRAQLIIAALIQQAQEARDA